MGLIESRLKQQAICSGDSGEGDSDLLIYIRDTENQFLPESYRQLIKLGGGSEDKEV
jgi:hypothetical protein